MARQAAFAGRHTIQKLDAIESYLRAYRNVLKNTSFTTIFFDAFAGTGELPVDDQEDTLFEGVFDKDEIIEGSAQRALQVQPLFHRYVFVEKAKGKADALREKLAKFPEAAKRADVITGEANAEVMRFCAETSWRSSRAVLFLDPFGNQVQWKTLEVIARCPIDLWYLFPSHLGVSRQINLDGTVDPAKAQSIDQLFGCTDWRESFLHREESRDLFGATEVSVRQASADAATRFMIGRMKTIFEGGVLDRWLPLGKNGAQWYSLLFAWGNRSEKAGRIARGIATHLMQRG
jgi:three-Cys-motif partner protein